MLLAKSKYKWGGWVFAPLFIIFTKYCWCVSHTIVNPFLDVTIKLSCWWWFSYYYLGILLGNKLIKTHFNYKTILKLILVSLLLQVAEGFVWLKFGGPNPGTQLKLTTLLSCSLLLLLSYGYIVSDTSFANSRILSLLGDYSFGIYLSHMLVIKVLSYVPIYSSILFPVNSVIVVLLSAFGVYLFNKIFGVRISGWFGFA